MCSGKVGDTSDAACGVEFEPAITAGNRGVAGNRNLDEEKVVEPIRVDLDLGAVFKPVDRRVALPKVMHLGPQIGAGAVQPQEMRLENAGHTLAHGVEIARREYQQLVRKGRICQQRRTPIHLTCFQAVLPSDRTDAQSADRTRLDQSVTKAGANRKQRLS